ncbi:kinase-like domain-containing protein [Trametes elegans]|nr:kinase-like domain-containing protein [Trametes elegans]
MSFFYSLLACVLPGLPAQSNSSTTPIGHGFPQSCSGDHIADVHPRPLLLRNASVTSSLVTFSTFSTVTRSDHSNTYGRHSGCGLFIAPALGLCMRLGLVSHPEVPSSGLFPDSGCAEKARRPSSLLLDEQVPNDLEPLDECEPLEAPKHSRSIPSAPGRPVVSEVHCHALPADPTHGLDLVSGTIPNQFRQSNVVRNSPGEHLTAKTIYVDMLRRGYPMPPRRGRHNFSPNTYIDNGPRHGDANGVCSGIDLPRSSSDTQPAWTPQHSSVALPAATAGSADVEINVRHGDKPANYLASYEPRADPGVPLSPPDTEPAWSPQPGIVKLPVSVGHGDGIDDELEDYHSSPADPESAKTRAPCADPEHPDGTVYRILGKLGDGGYGRVFLAGTSDGDTVALKAIYKPSLYRMSDAKKMLYVERDTMLEATQFRRPGCLPFLTTLRAAWEDEDNAYVAMDLCSENLRSRVRNTFRSGEGLPAKEMKLLCAEMLLALGQLEQLETIHGDIKPENFLITKTGRVVLADFGMAQRQQGSRKCSFHDWAAESTMGTAGYDAPESLLAQAGVDAPYTHKVDIFALGLVFVELLGRLAYPLWDPQAEAEDTEVDKEIWQQMQPHERQVARMMTEGLRDLDGDLMISDPDARDMVFQMLQPKPRTRPTARQLLMHPYFWDLNIDCVRAGRIPHHYRPRCFQSVDCSVQDASVSTWLSTSVETCKQDPRYQAQNTPLKDFTWPVVGRQNAYHK